MTLSKLVKQKIAFNYVKEKSADFVNDIIGINDKKYLAIRNRMFEIKGVELSDVEDFMVMASKLNPNFKRFLVKGQVNSNLTLNPTVTLNHYENKMSYWLNFNDSYQNVENFNYSPDSFLICLFKDYGKLMETDEQCKTIIRNAYNEEMEYKEKLQTLYNNIYELIRNIRTLDRIKKHYPDIEKYLPEDYKASLSKQEKESIEDKFAKL